MTEEKAPRLQTLLVVEDDPGLQNQLRWCFEGSSVIVAGDREGALNQLRRHEPPVVLLDLGLPPDPSNVSEGMAALVEILSLAPDTKVVVVTGNDGRDNAVRAVGAGAYDFYQKPIDADILKLIVNRAFRLHELERENRRLALRDVHSPLEGLVGVSVEMAKVCETVEKIAPTGVSVLLLGESGTGKELLARALHKLGPRKDQRFTVINCAAIPETLLESELFGYERGAFTGATRQTMGKIESAHGGTLFLDEIGDLPQSLQAKLLRFLQERKIERLGGREEIEVDVRIVSATHRNLLRMMQDGGFREDLFYRIAEVSVRIPPLRERVGDAALMARIFLDKSSRVYGKPRRGFTEEAIAAIQGYGWPGNVRELENRVKRAAIMAEGPHVSASDLELPSVTEEPLLPLNLRQVREEAERHAIRRVLACCDHKVTQAAEMLGVTRPTLYALLNKYGLRGGDKNRREQSEYQADGV
ncbi:MAG: PEP-CTERM-box response regulator transcription factor [Gammaproteobacteria bacterium]